MWNLVYFLFSYCTSYQVGLVNGAMGTVVAICCDGKDQLPLNLPLAVMVPFDSYTSPILSDGSVPIVPLCCTLLSSNNLCSRLQLFPQTGMGGNYSQVQGMTFDKVAIDVEKKEFSTWTDLCGLLTLGLHTTFSFHHVAHLTS